MADEIAPPPIAPLLVIAAVVSAVVIVSVEGWEAFLAAPFGAVGAALMGIPAVKLAHHFKIRAIWAAIAIGAFAAWMCALAAFLLISLLSSEWVPGAARDLLMGHPARVVLLIGAVTGTVYRGYWALFPRRR